LHQVIQNLILKKTQIVLANGTLLHTTATTHPTLFRALKGGSNNFGIVTRFDLSTFPQGAIASSRVFNDISQRGKVLGAFTDIVEAKGGFDVYASLVTSLVYTSGTGGWRIINIVAYTAPVTQPAVFKELLSIPSTTNNTSLAITTLAELADEVETSHSYEPPTNSNISPENSRLTSAQKPNHGHSDIQALPPPHARFLRHSE
jgi:hypothetical protein